MKCETELADMTRYLGFLESRFTGLISDNINLRLQRYALIAITLVMLVITLCGCDQNASGYEPDKTTIKAEVASQIAFYEPQPASNPKVQTTCDECRGTKQVRSGDGLAMVPCSCGENCKCQRTEEAKVGPPVGNRMLMFTATWCGPCQLWKQNNVAALNAQGWTVGPSRDDHIQTINYDVSQSLVRQYGVGPIPVFIMINSAGQEVARHTGNNLNAIETAEFFYNNQPLPRSSYPPAPEADPIEDVSETAWQSPPQRPAMVTRRGRIISRGCRGGRCR
ncbi:hypothetical protein Pan241w_11540 [Gimesia alba]|uniref:Thioredoxin domain-containing protein n=1 Tax=Gimesia alba TaxID=2527973 RepID=A0A517RB32_9PLAN|nr:thioredoxin family protein [Gimesia alba]QDT41095.1 hypothetical protein Pan241w_11540 [Gimesia alba]